MRIGVTLHVFFKVKMRSMVARFRLVDYGIRHAVSDYNVVVQETAHLVEY